MSTEYDGQQDLPVAPAESGAQLMAQAAATGSVPTDGPSSFLSGLPVSNAAADTATDAATMAAHLGRLDRGQVGEAQQPERWVHEALAAERAAIDAERARLAAERAELARLRSERECDRERERDGLPRTKEQEQGELSELRSRIHALELENERLRVPNATETPTVSIASGSTTSASESRSRESKVGEGEPNGDDAGAGSDKVDKACRSAEARRAEKARKAEESKRAREAKRAQRLEAKSRRREAKVSTEAEGNTLAAQWVETQASSDPIPPPPPAQEPEAESEAEVHPETLVSLFSVFPDAPTEVLKNALTRAKGDINAALDILFAAETGKDTSESAPGPGTEPSLPQPEEHSSDWGKLSVSPLGRKVDEGSSDPELAPMPPTHLPPAASHRATRKGKRGKKPPLVDDGASTLSGGSYCPATGSECSSAVTSPVPRSEHASPIVPSAAPFSAALTEASGDRAGSSKKKKKGVTLLQMGNVRQGGSDLVVPKPKQKAQGKQARKIKGDSVSSTPLAQEGESDEAFALRLASEPDSTGPAAPASNTGRIVTDNEWAFAVSVLTQLDTLLPPDRTGMEDAPSVTYRKLGLDLAETVRVVVHQASEQAPGTCGKAVEQGGEWCPEVEALAAMFAQPPSLVGVAFRAVRGREDEALDLLELLKSVHSWRRNTGRAGGDELPEAGWLGVGLADPTLLHLVGTASAAPHRSSTNRLAPGAPAASLAHSDPTSSGFVRHDAPSVRVVRKAKPGEGAFVYTGQRRDASFLGRAGSKVPLQEEETILAKLGQAPIVSLPSTASGPQTPLGVPAAAAAQQPAPTGRGGGSGGWSYADCRARERAARAARAEALQRAADAHAGKAVGVKGRAARLARGGAAAHHSRRAQELDGEVRLWSARAAHALVTERGAAGGDYAQTLPGEVVDLHHLSLEEALGVTRDVLADWSARAQAGQTGQALSIVTGVGRHSSNNVPIIKPNVKRLLNRAGYRYDDDHGVLTVHPPRRR